MRTVHGIVIVVVVLAGSGAARAGAPTAEQAARMYRWKRARADYEPLAARFAPPAGFRRDAAAPGSYAHWLRHLPLRVAGTPVRSYRGATILAADAPELAAVVDLDLGTRDRWHCADMVMRLRGEFLFFSGRADEARFRWAGAARFGYAQWRAGIRPVKRGRRWTFERRARPSRGYRSLRRYLGFMASFTGTVHQAGEPRVQRSQVRPGDFLIQGGSPGHVVVIVDLVRDARGRRRALIAQGFMPTQDLQLLRAADGSPWFALDPAVGTIDTPRWRPFHWSDLSRFRY